MNIQFENDMQVSETKTHVTKADSKRFAYSKKHCDTKVSLEVTSDHGKKSRDSRFSGKTYFSLHYSQLFRFYNA